MRRGLHKAFALGLASACLACVAHAASDDKPKTSPDKEPGPGRFEEAGGGSFQMDLQESPDLRLMYFDPPQTYLTPYVIANFYNSLAFQTETFDWEPWEKTTVLLKDFSDYGNAGARSSPNNALLIDVAPLSRTFETFIASERIYSLMNHELVHVATMDVWNERDRFWRDFFRGKPMPEQKHPESILYNYLTTPRVSVPRWYLEGSAVFMETWMAGGHGRALGAYDEMVFRSMVRDDAKFYSPLGLVSEGVKVDFQGGVNAYLYGTRFFNYLALTYSPETVIAWLSRGPDSRAYYSANFREVFGLRLDDAWSEWIQWEHEFQRGNLDAVRQFPVTTGERLSPRALGSLSRAYFNPASGSLVGAFRYPGVVAHIGELSITDGDIRKLKDIKGPMLYRVTSLAYDPARNIAWYTTDNYAFRDLIQIDIETGKSKAVLKDARIGDIAFNPADRSLWGVRHLNGYASLVRIPEPYDSWNLVRLFPYGETAYDLDVSPDGALLTVTVGDRTGDQTLKVFRTQDLLATQGRSDAAAPAVASYQPGPAMPEGAAFSADSGFVYGSAYVRGVSNIFRLDVATNAVEYVSNAETGYFRPIPMADGSLIVFEYTGDGFTPVRIDPSLQDDLPEVRFLGDRVAEKHEDAIASLAVGPPASAEFDASAITKGTYRPRRQIRLASAYPITEGYKNGVAVGYHFNFEDPMQFTRLGVTLSWSAIEGDAAGGERFHADIQYKGLNWRARYWHNDADFYDLFGPTKRARKGDAFLLGYDKYVIFDKPRELKLSVDLGYFTGLDVLPANQNVATQFDEIFSAQIAAHYTDTQKSLGSVDHEKGWRWDVAATSDTAAHQTAFKVRGGVDFGFALPIRNSSVWFYNSGGVSDGDGANPLSSFYFGGFKNNYVDDREIKRYRQFDAFPGFEIDELAARDFVKSVAEWNAPPLRFESVGAPSLYLESARTALFAGALWADPGRVSDRVAISLGGQVDFNFTVVHRLPMTLSIGYAAGFLDGEDRSDEFMLSLKVM